jgi:hypothetical protein
VTTPERGGLGIAKDLYKEAGLEVDLGAYVTHDYWGLFPACAATFVASRQAGRTACGRSSARSSLTCLRRRAAGRPGPAER